MAKKGKSKQPRCLKRVGATKGKCVWYAGQPRPKGLKKRGGYKKVGRCVGKPFKVKVGKQVRCACVTRGKSGVLRSRLLKNNRCVRGAKMMTFKQAKKSAA